MKHNKFAYSLLAAASCIVLALLTGCGAKESQGGLLGAATGAAIGSAVSGDKGEGAIAGAAIGAFVGSKIGRSADEEDKAEQHRKEVSKLKDEKRRLQRKLDRWCESCRNKSRITGAQSCPDCGGRLVYELFCDQCKTSFSPETGYRFCPYCQKARLRGR